MVAGRPRGKLPGTSIVLAVLLALSAVVVTSAPGVAASNPVEFGVAPDGSFDGRIGGLNDVEARLGRTADFVRVFELWDSSFPTAYHQLLVDTDRRMLLSVRAKRLDGSFVPWRDIADAQPGSQIHSELVAWVQKIDALGVPVWFTFNHEPEVVENIANGTDQDFIDAWRRITAEFAAQGVADVEFVWIMTDYSFGVDSTDRRHAPLWYPGDDVVDHIGADAYNYSDCRPDEPITWRPLVDFIDDFRVFGLDHPDKGLILSEWASTEQPGDDGAAKAAWISEAAALLQQAGWEQFIAVSYFDRIEPNHAACAWNVDSTPAAEEALRAMASDPFYGGGSPGPGGVMLVVANPASIAPGDAAVIDRLTNTLGTSVSVVDDQAVTAGMAAGYDLVIISSSVATGPLLTTFYLVDKPVWVSKPWLLDDVAMTGPTGGTDYGITTTSEVSIVDASHVLAAGLNGTVPFTATSRLIQFGIPAASADVVASANGLPTVFVYQPGTLLADGSTAAGCRLAMSIYQRAATEFTTEGWALFDAAATYGLGGCDAGSPADPPSVTLTSPPADATVEGTISITADATDTDGVAQVEFFADGASLAVDTDGTDGWTAQWDTTATADATGVAVSATATDTNGDTASDTVIVTVDNDGPSVTITQPADGATVSGTVAISADATDAIAVAQVEFFADGVSLAVDTDGTDGWTAQWDTTGHPDGAVVTLSAVAADTFGRTDSSAIVVTVDASEALQVVFVAGNPDSLNAGEVAVIDRLASLGMSLTVIDDNSATAADANGANLVIVSSTTNSNTVGSTFVGVSATVWVAKPWLLDDMGMAGTTNGDYGSVSASTIDIVEPSHSLAAGFSGTVPFTSSPRRAQYGAPGGDATVVATVDGMPTIYVFEAGGVLTDGTSAPGCRLAFSIFQQAPTAFTTEAWTLFDTATMFAAGGCAAP